MSFYKITLLNVVGSRKIDFEFSRYIFVTSHLCQSAVLPDTLLYLFCDWSSIPKYITLSVQVKPHCEPHNYSDFAIIANLWLVIYTRMRADLLTQTPSWSPF